MCLGRGGGPYPRRKSSVKKYRKFKIELLRLNIVVHRRWDLCALSIRNEGNCKVARAIGWV